MTNTSASATKKSLSPTELTLILVFGCLIAMISNGARSSFGLFGPPISDELGWPPSVFGGTSLAIQNLMWGLIGTFAAIIADRKGPMPVLMTGAVLYFIGMVGMAMTSSIWVAHLMMGLVAGAGISATGFALVATSFGKLVPPHRRGWALGLGTAAASFGQFSIGTPTGMLLASDGADWRQILIGLSFLVLIMGLFALVFRKAGDPAYVQESANFKNAAAQQMTPWQAIARAMSHRGYLLLFFGFFVCGFHISIIYIFLPEYLRLFDNIPGSMASWALGIVGIFNIIGAYSAGIIGDKMGGNKRWPLASIYLLRSVVILGFILLPVTVGSTALFAALMGLLWLSTVPLTSGIVAQQWGAKYLSTLYGMVFFSHQVGSFAGSQLAGWLLDQYQDGVYVGPAIFTPLLNGWNDGFGPMWWSAILMGIFAFVVHLPINEEPVSYEHLAGKEAST